MLIFWANFNLIKILQNFLEGWKTSITSYSVLATTRLKLDQKQICKFFFNCFLAWMLRMTLTSFSWTQLIKWRSSASERRLSSTRNTMRWSQNSKALVKSVQESKKDERTISLVPRTVSVPFLDFIATVPAKQLSCLARYRSRLNLIYPRKEVQETCTINFVPSEDEEEDESTVIN